MTRGGCQGAGGRQPQGRGLEQVDGRALARDRGPGRAASARAAQRDHRRPGGPRRPLPGRERAAHRRHGGRPALADSAGRHGDGQRHGRADGQDRDRRARHDGHARLSMRLACRRHGAPRRGAGLGPRAGRHRAAGRRGVRRRRHGRLAHGRGRGRQPRARGPRGRGRRGQRRGRHRHGLLRLPGRHRHRLARSSASTSSACCCSATSATATTSTCRAWSSSRSPAKRPDTGSCIWVCATDAPLSALQLKRLALRPGLGLARTGSYGAEGSGEIGLAFSTASEGEIPNAGLDPFFAAAYEAAHEAVYNCLVAARPAERLDGTMQEAFPIDAVRSR